MTDQNHTDKSNDENRHCSASSGSASDNYTDDAQDAISRMKRANDRGTGCNLTADMIKGLSLSFLGEIWEEEDPRQNTKIGQSDK